PNRPDCLSIIGIARELSAKLKLNLKMPEVYQTEKSKDTFSVEIVELDLCRRYIACLLKNVNVKHSPLKIKLRLKKCGLRPINNIVDITNYVLLEFGHPLHAFDFEKLNGNKIIVRKAKQKERILGLDGKEYELDEEMLVISDSEKAQAIAGVIGSQSSGVTESTKEILLESAIFNPQNIRRTRQKLNISTESSYRFERGTTWENCDLASKRAIYLFQEFADAKFITRNDIFREKPKKETITLRINRLNSILSTQYDKKEIAEILTSLGMEIEPQQENFNVTVASHRVDIKEEIDLIEEVARIKGYENIPVKVCATNIPIYIIPNSILEIQTITRKFLTSLGFWEAVNYGFITEKDYIKLKSYGINKIPIEIENPLSKETQFLRISLLPELMKNLSTNLDNQFENIKLFEIGKIFFMENGKPEEKNVVGLIATGNITKPHWKYKSEKIDFDY
ncbi:MAG: phenylalanine--tRNA ligase subunit beta, partial [Endomicrobiia bacterium]